jgi:DNA-binding transcriptional regulator LsrR (DeoR family)
MLHEMTIQRSRTHAQELIELKTGRNLPDLLYDMYVRQGKSQEFIAAELGIQRLTVNRWLLEFGIKKGLIA